MADGLDSGAFFPACINHSFAAGGRRRYFTQRLARHHGSPKPKPRRIDTRRNTMPALIAYGFASVLGLVGVIAPIFG
ncbi:hypothetical protein [Pandoraea morbifera]|uniref:hypothetical protein n=1 Tax=Pandoraea morbifera TaxID=2508300 RepID=UPI001241117A|nr:hypothetical protein [Pandoraea morbifera]